MMIVFRIGASVLRSRERQPGGESFFFILFGRAFFKAADAPFNVLDLNYLNGTANDEDNAMSSSGVSCPSPSLVKIAAMALSASRELFMGGMLTLIGWAFRGGQILSRIMRWHDTSPARAARKIF